MIHCLKRIIYTQNTDKINNNFNRINTYISNILYACYVRNFAITPKNIKDPCYVRVHISCNYHTKNRRKNFFRKKNYSYAALTQFIYSWRKTVCMWCGRSEKHPEAFHMLVIVESQGFFWLCCYGNVIYVPHRIYTPHPSKWCFVYNYMDILSDESNIVLYDGFHAFLG